MKYVNWKKPTNVARKAMKKHTITPKFFKREPFNEKPYNDMYDPPLLK